MTKAQYAVLFGLIAALQLAPAAPPPAESKHPTEADWPVYGASAYQDRYSELTQINPSNVSQMRLAWRFDMPEPGDPIRNE